MTSACPSSTPHTATTERAMASPSTVAAVQPKRTSSPFPKRLRHVLRVVFYMLRKALLSVRRPPFLDLHLLLKRGKLAGKKAFTNLLHYHHHHDNNSGRYCFDPRGIGFSCSSTPSGKRREYGLYQLDPEAIAAALGSPGGELDQWAVGSPWWALGRSPAVAVRQLRVTDSPFPLVEEEEEGGVGWSVDEEAEAFIERFYEELRRQQGWAAEMDGSGADG